MKITLRQLQIFDAVATHGSVTAAAERLGMSQSTVSSTLKDLQIILERPLFSFQKGRNIVMTDEGRQMRASIRSALVAIEEIELQSRDKLAGQLLIGATEFAAETVLPGPCVEFRERHPGARIQLQTASAKTLFEQVGQLNLHSAVMEIYPDLQSPTIFQGVPELEITKWVYDELNLFVSPQHPLAARDNLRLSEIVTWPWCLREPESTLFHILHGKLSTMGHRVEPTFVSTSDNALRLMAIGGGGIVCLSTRSVAADVAEGRLSQLDVPEFRLARNLCLVRPHGMRRPRIVAEFDSFLLARRI